MLLEAFVGDPHSLLEGAGDLLDDLLDRAVLTDALVGGRPARRRGATVLSLSLAILLGIFGSSFSFQVGPRSRLQVQNTGFRLLTPPPVHLY